MAMRGRLPNSYHVPLLLVNRLANSDVTTTPQAAFKMRTHFDDWSLTWQSYCSNRQQHELNKSIEFNGTLRYDETLSTTMRAYTLRDMINCEHVEGNTESK